MTMMMSSGVVSRLSRSSIRTRSISSSNLRFPTITTTATNTFSVLTSPSSPSSPSSSSSCPQFHHHHQYQSMYHHQYQYHHHLYQNNNHHRRWKHTVRVIFLENTGPHYEGDVVSDIRAGYARNFLIPQKKALYATAGNFRRLGRSDPDMETPEERRERLAREAEDEDNEELKAAKLLKYYLRNKVLTIWRKVDDAAPTMLHPGMVDSKAIRQKLSIQLKIDLDDTEEVHIQQASVSHNELTEGDLETLMEEIGSAEPCTVQLRQLGQYVAKISLAGGYSVPLKFIIVKR